MTDSHLVVAYFILGFSAYALWVGLNVWFWAIHAAFDNPLLLIFGIISPAILWALWTVWRLS